jgi:hypothetical protein
VGPLQTLGPAATSTLFTALGLGLVVLMLGVWIARFLGYFGGPVPVTSVWSWR